LRTNVIKGKAPYLRPLHATRVFAVQRDQEIAERTITFPFLYPRTNIQEILNRKNPQRKKLVAEKKEKGFDVQPQASSEMNGCGYRIENLKVRMDQGVKKRIGNEA